MKNTNQLSLPDGITHTPRGVAFPESMSAEQWQGYGRFLKEARGALLFWEADWLAAGRARFGDEVVRQAVAQLELDLGDVAKSQKLLSAGKRWEALDAGHHFVLASAALDETAKEMWAKLAIKHRLSADELRMSVRAGEVQRAEKRISSRRAGVATCQWVRQAFGFLWRQIGEEWRSWDDRVCHEFLQDMWPIVEAFHKIEARRIQAGYGEEDLERLTRVVAMFRELPKEERKVTLIMQSESIGWDRAERMRRAALIELED